MMLNNFSNSEERLALAKIQDMINSCRRQHKNAYSDFLDPVKARKFYDLLANERDVTLYIWGGYEAAERKMLGVCPEYAEIEMSDFPITVLRVAYNSKYSRELAHRDFLGGIMGLGIDRSRVGDIIVAENAAQVFISREISAYVAANLEKVGAAKVTVTEQGIEVVAEETQTGEELRVTVASLRLDAVLSAAFRISRAKSAGLIEGEKASVNWSMADNPSRQLKEGDIITLRGIGRIKLAMIDGKTKKDRLAIHIVKY